MIEPFSESRRVDVDRHRQFLVAKQYDILVHLRETVKNLLPPRGSGL